MELDGHFLLCQLCQHCSAASTPKLLESSARAVCALVPPARERDALVADNRESKMETKSIALKALERARHLLWQDSQHQHHGEEEDAALKGRRRWLTQTIDLLKTTKCCPHPTNLQQQRLKRLKASWSTVLLSSGKEVASQWSLSRLLLPMSSVPISTTNKTRSVGQSVAVCI